ncbi:hypothetical protein DTO195F2_4929 [Paecilomyces variotii]|nr:hypothetical protein DTO195F2_4929 [Paecilomyces variotii]KAJ9349624.1 hypothetical protein DTO027B9_7524 [Paecilomyces variotii]
MGPNLSLLDETGSDLGAEIYMPYTKRTSVDAVYRSSHVHRHKSGHHRSVEKSNVTVHAVIPTYGNKQSKQTQRQEITQALDLSLTQRTLSDLAPHERPLTGPGECIICLETFPPSSFPDRAISSICDHTSPERHQQRVCRGCLAQHLDAQLNNSGPDRLTCPICLAALAHTEIKQWASPATFVRYDSLQARTAISSDPNFIWCCNPTCGAGQLHVSGAESPIVICHACGARTCFNHPNAIWHEGFTCYEFDHPEVAEERRRQEATETEALVQAQQEENDRIREQVQRDRRLAMELQEEDGQQEGSQLITNVAEIEKGQQTNEEEVLQQMEAEQRRVDEVTRTRARNQEAEAAIERNRLQERAERRKEELQGEPEVSRTSKPCPGANCSYWIVKVDGCKHMTCSRCHHEWCWVCNQPWRNGHLNAACG